jgi:hypothetical protein
MLFHLDKARALHHVSVALQVDPRAPASLPVGIRRAAGAVGAVLDAPSASLAVKARKLPQGCLLISIRVFSPSLRDRLFCFLGRRQWESLLGDTIWHVRQINHSQLVSSFAMGERLSMATTGRAPDETRGSNKNPCHPCGTIPYGWRRRTGYFRCSRAAALVTVMDLAGRATAPGFPATGLVRAAPVMALGWQAQDLAPEAAVATALGWQAQDLAPEAAVATVPAVATERAGPVLGLHLCGDQSVRFIFITGRHRYDITMPRTSIAAHPLK